MLKNLSSRRRTKKESLEFFTERRDRKEGVGEVPKAQGKRASQCQLLPEARRTKPSELATKRPHALMTVVSTDQPWHKLLFKLNHWENDTIFVIIKRNQ